MFDHIGALSSAMCMMNRASSGDRCIMVGRTAFSRSIIRETTATVLSDLIVSSLAAFEACAANRNTYFAVPDAAAGKRCIYVRTQCSVASKSDANSLNRRVGDESCHFRSSSRDSIRTSIIPLLY